MNINFISAMGAAKKLDPKSIGIMSINDTINDPLARIIKKQLRNDNIIKDFTVLSSKEPPIKIKELGSYIGVVAIGGILIADYIIKQIIKG